MAYEQHLAELAVYAEAEYNPALARALGASAEDVERACAKQLAFKKLAPEHQRALNDLTKSMLTDEERIAKGTAWAVTDADLARSQQGIARLHSEQQAHADDQMARADGVPIFTKHSGATLPLLRHREQ